MYGTIILKDFFSLLNILLIVYLLMDTEKSKSLKPKNEYFYFLCIGSLLFVRIMENGVSLHILYNYITIVIDVIIIGYFIFRRDIKYCTLIGIIFLSIVVVGQLLCCILFYLYSSKSILAELSAKYQMGMIIIAEVVILIGCLLLKRIIEKIPSFLTGSNMIIISIPLLFNIGVMAIYADQLYYEKKMLVDNMWSSITILGVCIAMFVGTVCNIIILENYLNVKKIENEKKLQISEMSLQYDYYLKQSNDMENIRRLSHDIKNHLEALKANIDPEQKIEYINGIERKLSKYQSYYKTGNTFIDNLLHVKRVEAVEQGIEFKVFVDFTPFKKIRNEDLCVIISNTLDNALRECQLIKEENSETECLIQLKAKKVKGFLSILCENSLREDQATLLMRNAELETSKADKKNHGFGIKNIKSVVQNYGGEVTFNVIDDMFSVSVLIPIEL